MCGKPIKGNIYWYLVPSFTILSRNLSTITHLPLTSKLDTVSNLNIVDVFPIRYWFWFMSLIIFVLWQDLKTVVLEVGILISVWNKRKKMLKCSVLQNFFKSLTQHSKIFSMI